MFHAQSYFVVPLPNGLMVTCYPILANKHDQNAIATQNSKIQDKLEGGPGIIVGKPKPGGSGNTNDGNTAR